MPRLHTSADWRDVFARNTTADRPIPWDQTVRWTTEDRRAIVASVQEFQLGEQSEGRYLRLCADRYAARTGDVDYPKAMRLFVGEEARHAAELARLLTSAGERLKTTTPLDGVFRIVRKLGSGDGLEVCLRVLVTAEIVALSYYAALRDATECPVTQALCAQILRDESAHVRFHAERLALFQAARWPLARGIVRAAHHVLMVGTTLAVWAGTHRRVFRRSGLTYADFATDASRTLARRVLRVEADAHTSSHSALPIPA